MKSQESVPRLPEGPGPRSRASPPAAVTGATWLPGSPLGHEDAAKSAMQVAKMVMHRSACHANPPLRAADVGRAPRARGPSMNKFAECDGALSSPTVPCISPPTAAPRHSPSSPQEVVAYISSPWHRAALTLSVSLPLCQLFR